MAEEVPRYQDQAYIVDLGCLVLAKLYDTEWKLWASRRLHAL